MRGVLPRSQVQGAAARMMPEPAPALPLTPLPFRRPSEDEFHLFQRLVSREAGIFLSEAKRELLVSRLARRLRLLGLCSFGAYYKVVKQDKEERVRMLDCICTNETQFFREPCHFEFLERQLFPKWRRQEAAGRRRRRIQAWSAGCSTGEEPYSLAMALLYHFPDWQIDILATDLSTRAIDHARAAVWPIAKKHKIPRPYLKRFMLKGVEAQAGKMRAGPEIRSRVRFERLNLNKDVCSLGECFELIFCRNVLIYFSRESRARVFHRLLDRLSGAGHLFLGHAESLAGVGHRARAVMPTVYVSAVGQPPGRRIEPRRVP